MLKNLPSTLEKDLFEHCKQSLSSGIQARRVGITWLSVVSVLLLLMVVVSVGFGSVFFVVLTILAATYFIVWAIYSISASANMQFDILTRLVVHYAESNKGNN